MFQIKTNLYIFIKYFLSIVILSIGLTHTTQAENIPIIAAASSIKFPLEEIAQHFTKETGKKLKLSFGSSGNFTRQIMQQAPFELFISADESYVLKLYQLGLTQDEGVIYASGKLALFVPKNSSLKLDNELNGLKQALKEGKIQRFVIANPEVAPYGRMAKQVLENKGLWQELQKKLVLAENVAQSASIAMSGATQGGIIAYAYTFNENIKNAGHFVLLPENLHQPLYARMVLTKNASETAKGFYQYLQQSKAKKILARYGFE